MANRHDVARLHRQHPEWTAPEMAAALRCTQEYVRATARRRGLTLAKTRPGSLADPDSIVSLGRAAQAAGLTLARIRQLADATFPPARRDLARAHRHRTRRADDSAAKSCKPQPAPAEPVVVPDAVKAECERRRVTAPRDLTAAVLGDPPPGFSALDRRGGR